MKKYESYYNLPNKVTFCKKCVLSNQRPASVPELKHTRNRDGAKYLNIDKSGVCDACNYHVNKAKEIDWDVREKELEALLDKYRRNDGHYDCLVPGSGGKDSAYQAHILKYKYGMHPLTVTWPPIMYTDYGYKNWKNWLDSGFDNLTFTRNGKVMKLLTRLSIENLLHPFQTFIFGQYNLAPKLAKKYDISLIFYGETASDYGNPIIENSKSLRSKSYHSYDKLSEIHLAGLPIKRIMEEHDLELVDLMPFLPITESELAKSDMKIIALGYYLKWVPQEVYYYAVENTDFKARPFRTQGTYSKYNSIDDKIDDLHYYTTFIKFGIGRATYDASQEIRNKHLSREEAQALVNRFDGEFPDRYFDEIMDYIGMEPERFHDLCDEFRSPHLWKKENGDWKLRHTVNRDGVDD